MTEDRDPTPLTRDQEAVVSAVLDRLDDQLAELSSIRGAVGFLAWVVALGIAFTVIATFYAVVNARG